MSWASDMISTTCWVISPKRTCMSRRVSARCYCVLAFDRRSSTKAFGLAWAASTSNPWVFDRTIFLAGMILVVRKAYSEGCGRGFFGTGVRLWARLRIRLPEMATLPACKRVPVPWAPHNFYHGIHTTVHCRMHSWLIAGSNDVYFPQRATEMWVIPWLTKNAGEERRQKCANTTSKHN